MKLMHMILLGLLLVLISVVMDKMLVVDNTVDQAEQNLIHVLKQWK